MKKAAIGMLVVLALTFGPVPMGESAEKNHIGCINYFVLKMDRTNKRVATIVRVGDKSFSFHGSLGKIKQSSSMIWMTASQLAAWEPVFEHLRAAATAKVKVRIGYDASSRWVRFLRPNFNQPC